MNKLMNKKNIKNLDLTFIEFDKIYKDKLTIFEKSIINWKYNNLRKYCYERLKQKYDIKNYHHYQ